MSADPLSEPKDVAEAAPGEHLSAEDLHGLLEDHAPRRKRRALEAHLASCAACVETMAMVLRADRPASREEQQQLARIPERGVDTILTALRPHIEATTHRTALEWKPIVIAAGIALLLLGTGLHVRSHYWLPAAARRTAAETLDALVELRQATGRLPLRYITEFERAGIVRSSFDTTEGAEDALLGNLEASVARTLEPEPDALLVLGLLRLDDGRLDEAEELLGQVRDLNPDSVDAINGLAVIDYERAMLKPDEAHAFHQRGLALLRQAARRDPNDLRVLYNFGKFYEAMNMNSAAIKAWTRYLEKDRASQWAEEAAHRLSQLDPRGAVRPRVR